MTIVVDDRIISPDAPVYFVAEISANHRQRFEVAVELVKAAKKAGADAVKVQLYTPDSMTLPIETDDFYIKTGLWKDTSLWNLYTHTCMPWAWYPELLTLAKAVEITLFPTVYDLKSLEFAEQFPTPAYKIASMEIGDRSLIRAVAATGKPVLISDGYAVDDDYDFINRVFGANPYLILRCVPDYPATPSVEVLDYIEFASPSGVSDHTAGIGFPILCAVFGASVIEKHVWTGRGECADREFSITPDEFGAMVRAVRAVEESQRELNVERRRSKPRAQFQRSIYAARDIAKGATITADDVRVVRPGFGLDPRRYDDVIGATATIAVPYGAAMKENYFKPVTKE